MKKPASTLWLSILSPIVMIALWELAVYLRWLDPLFFPAPSTIALAFFDFARSGEMLANCWITLQRIAIGFLIGAIPGVALGLFSGTNRWIAAALDPVIALLYPIPKIAILPLVLLIFGVGEESKWALVSIGVFFITFINTESGVRQIDQIYFDVARAFRIRPLRFYLGVILPGAMENVFTGLRLSVGVAVVLAVAAEFTAAKSGLGHTIWNGWQTLQVEKMYVALVLVSVIGFLLSLAVEYCEKLLAPWRAARKILLMLTTFSRAMVVLASAALLAACSDGATPNTGVGPGLSNPAGYLAATAQSSPNPCAIKHGWTFHGPCKEFALPSYPGPIIAFPSYRGLTIDTHFGGNTSDGQPFILGMGTSKADITGTDSGITFPVYGSAKGGCTDAYFNNIKCHGKGVAYVLMMIPSTNSWPTGLQYTPIFHIRKAGAFPGTKCQQASLISEAGTLAWRDLPQIVTPHNGVIRFKPFQWILTLQQNTFEVEAFHCFS